MKGEQNIQAPKSINYIVQSALNRLGVDTDKYMDRYRVVALEYYSEHLNLFYLTNITAKYYMPTASNVFQLPPDYVDYTKVGIEINGEVWTLGLNEKIAKPQQEACGDYVLSPSRPTGGYVFADYYNGQGVLKSGALGIGGGWNIGYFNIDKTSNTLSVVGNLPKQPIILEYTSSGVRRDGTTMVPLEGVNCIRQMIMFVHMASHKSIYGSYETTRQEKRVEDAEILLDRLIDTPTMDEILDLFYQSYHQGVKR